MRQLQDEIVTRHNDASQLARTVAALRVERTQLETELECVRAAARADRAALAGIYSSLSWSAVRLLARARDVAVPRGTWRRRCYERLRDALKRAVALRPGGVPMDDRPARGLSASRLWPWHAVAIPLVPVEADASRPAKPDGAADPCANGGCTEVDVPARLTAHVVVARGAALDLTLAASTRFQGTRALHASLLVTGPGTSLQVARTVSLESASAHRVFRVRVGHLAGRAMSIQISLAPVGTVPGWRESVYVALAMRSRKRVGEAWRGALGRLRLTGARATLAEAWQRLAAPPQSPIGATRLDASAPQPSSAPAAAPARAEAVSWRAQAKVDIFMPIDRAPVVSIIIPAFNRVELLHRCLRSIVQSGYNRHEVIVIDDASSDETPQLLARVRGITRITHSRRADFISSCNEGAARAQGRYLLFLNSDTELHPRALGALVSSLDDDATCGAVGARLVHPDGTLQEAGSVVWRDGSTAAYGRGSDPDRPEYGHRRDVDYCSAACLLVRTDAFRALGGFDVQYRPAYYEDVDLCFRMRTLGYSVRVDPRAIVLHHEFGSRPAADAMSLMQVNRRRFARTFRGALESQLQPSDLLRARDRRPGRRTLVLDDQVPAPFLGAGFPRTRQLVEILSDLGCVVTFAATTAAQPHHGTVDELRGLGIEVFPGAGVDPEHLLRDRAGFYDVVVISRPHNGARFLDLVRATQPGALVIYDAEALYFQRELQRAAALGESLQPYRRRELMERELRLMRKADRVITVSESDRRTIVRETGHPRVWTWGLPQEPRSASIGPEHRRDLLFVGGFGGGHPPNTDAVSRLVRDLLPRIRTQLKDCRLFVVGSQPTAAIRQLGSLHTIITGYVEDLTPYYDECRVFVAPFRLGAGISCKVVEAMGNGIPAVVSPLIADGLGVSDEREVLVGRDDDEFASQVVRVCNDAELWLRLQRHATAWVTSHCAPSVMRETMAEIVGVDTADERTYRQGPVSA